MKHMPLISPFSIIQDRMLPDGGFAAYPNGEYRPDATAWAVLVLKAFGQDNSRIEAARIRKYKEFLKSGGINPNQISFEETQPTIRYRENGGMIIIYIS